MSLTKQTSIDQITALEDGTVLWRETTIIFEDGVELTKKYHRGSIEPGTDVSAFDAKIQTICNAIWTPEVVAAFRQKLQEQA